MNLLVGYQIQKSLCPMNIDIRFPEILVNIYSMSQETGPGEEQKNRVQESVKVQQSCTITLPWTL